MLDGGGMRLMPSGAPLYTAGGSGKTTHQTLVMTGGVLLDPCAHRAYFWVLFITQIQNAEFFSTELGSLLLLGMQDSYSAVG